MIHIHVFIYIFKTVDTWQEESGPYFLRTQETKKKRKKANDIKTKHLKATTTKKKKKERKAEVGWSMGCASSIHISDRVVYHSGKESEDSHSPQQTNTTQHQGNPASGLPLKPPSSKVRQPAFITLTQVCVFQCVCVLCVKLLIWHQTSYLQNVLVTF